MLLENTDPGNASMKRAPAGQRPAILIGVSHCGLQSGDFGNRPQVMLRWELHDEDGSVFMDSDNKVYVASQTYNMTIKNDLEGKASTFARVLNAHGINTSVGSKTDSKDWLGRVAMITNELDASGKYSNVVRVDSLPESLKDVEFEPTLAIEHWEPTRGQESRDKNPPPAWSEWKIGYSVDINHLASEQFRKGPRGMGQPAGYTQQGPQRQPARAGQQGGYMPSADDQGEDIPFHHDPSYDIYDDMTGW